MARKVEVQPYNRFDAEVSGLSVNEVHAFGENFAKFMKRQDVWSPSAWANNIGKTEDFIDSLNRMHFKQFSPYFELGMEVLYNRLLQAGMEGGCDRWTLKTLITMYNAKVRDYDKQCKRFEAMLGKEDNPDLETKMDRLNAGLAIAYKHIDELQDA